MITTPSLETALRDAILHLEEFIGSDCECDNTHEANEIECCLCQYHRALGDSVSEKSKEG